MPDPDPTKTTDPKAGETDPETDPEGGEGTTDPKVASTPEELLELVRKKDQENVKLKRERKESTKELERLQAIEEEHKSESEKALDTARQEGHDAAEAEFTSQLLAERIMRRATGKLADPSDVILIDFSTIDDADDVKQIDAAIDALLEAKPHLAVPEGGAELQPAGTIFEQGPRGKITTGKLTQGQQAEKWLRSQF